MENTPKKVAKKAVVKKKDVAKTKAAMKQKAAACQTPKEASKQQTKASAAEIRKHIPLDDPYKVPDIQREGSKPVDHGRRLDSSIQLLEIPEEVSLVMTLSTVAHEIRYLSTCPIVSVNGTRVPPCVNAKPAVVGQIRKRCVAFSVLPIQSRDTVLPMFLLPEEHARFMETGQLPFDSVTGKVREDQCLLCWRSDATFNAYFHLMRGFVPQNTRPIPFCNKAEGPQGYNRAAMVNVNATNSVAKFDASALCWRDDPITRMPFIDQSMIQWRDEIPSAAHQGF